MNKDDQELLKQMKIGLPIQKRAFVMFLMNTNNFNVDKLISRSLPFLTESPKHFGYFKMKEVPKYHLGWASTELLMKKDDSDCSGELEKKAVKKKVLEELEVLAKVAEKMSNAESFECIETKCNGEEYFYDSKIKNSILLSIFNLDPEKSAAKKYTDIKTPADLFKLLENMTVKSSPNKWSDTMLFTDEINLIVKQVKSSKTELNTYFGNK